MSVECRGTKKTWLFFPILIIAASFVVGLLWPMARTASAQGSKPSKPSPRETDAQRLEGRWVRGDGGYLLELRKVHKDGGLEAFYFNPRPIRVSQAVWARQGGKITVMVELRDVNYPGSTYNLQYDPESDRLKGTYYQAVERQTFEIQFLRSK